MPTPSPCMWNRGRASASRSSGVHRQARRTASAPASRLAWLSMAPLGAPGRARRVAEQRDVVRARVVEIEVVEVVEVEVEVVGVAVSGGLRREDDQRITRRRPHPSRPLVVIDDGRCRPGVLHNVSDLPLPVARVDRHDDRSKAERGHVRDDEPDRRCSAQQHAVARPHALVPQPPRHLARTPLEVRRGDPSLDGVVEDGCPWPLRPTPCPRSSERPFGRKIEVRTPQLHRQVHRPGRVLHGRRRYRDSPATKPAAPPLTAEVPRTPPSPARPLTAEAVVPPASPAQIRRAWRGPCRRSLGAWRCRGCRGRRGSGPARCRPSPRGRS